jgi:hypothetical protein
LEDIGMSEPINLSRIINALEGADAIISNATTLERGDINFDGHPPQDIEEISKILKLARSNRSLLDERGLKLLKSTEDRAKWVYGNHFEEDPWDDFDEDE